MENVKGLALHAVNAIGLLLVVGIWWYGALAVWRDLGLGQEFRSLMGGAAYGNEYVVQPTPGKRR